jgi:hypothetical protein
MFATLVRGRSSARVCSSVGRCGLRRRAHEAVTRGRLPRPARARTHDDVARRAVQVPPGHVLPVGGGVIISSLLPVSCDLPLGPRSRGREGISDDVSRETHSAGGSRPAAVDNARGGIEVAGSSPSTEGGSKPNLLERCAEAGVPRFTTLGKVGRATRQGADSAQGARSGAVHRVTVSMRQDQVPASTSPPQSPLHGVSTVGASGRRARLWRP